MAYSTRAMRGRIRARQATDEGNRRRHSAARVNPVADSVAAILAGDTLPFDFVHRLTAAGRYGSAFRVLWNEARALCDPDYLVAGCAWPDMGVAAFRCAIAFAVRKRVLSGSPLEPFNVSDLRRLKSEAARCALAVLGEPVSEWSTLPRRERAAFLLGEIVRARLA